MIYPGRSYPSLAQKCQDVADTPAAPKPTCRVAVLLTVSVCVDGVAEMSGVNQQRARCTSMSAGALAARLRAYRRTLKHWLCLGSLKDVEDVENLQHIENLRDFEEAEEAEEAEEVGDFQQRKRCRGHGG